MTETALREAFRAGWVAGKFSDEGIDKTFTEWYTSFKKAKHVTNRRRGW